MSYLNALDTVSAGSRIVKRAASVSSHIVPDVPPSAVGTSSFDDFLRSNKELPANQPKDGVGTMAGAALGGMFWHNHRILGIIGGASLGRNVPGIFNGDTRREAVGNLGQTGAAITGALALPGAPITGFAIGWLAGGALLYYTKARE